MSMAMPDAVILVNIIYVGLKTSVYTVPDEFCYDSGVNGSKY